MTTNGGGGRSKIGAPDAFVDGHMLDPQAKLEEGESCKARATTALCPNDADREKRQSNVRWAVCKCHKTSNKHLALRVLLISEGRMGPQNKTTSSPAGGKLPAPRQTEVLNQRQRPESSSPRATRLNWSLQPPQLPRALGGSKKQKPKVWTLILLWCRV